MATLYELTAAYAELIAAYEQAEDDDQAAAALEGLDALDADVTDKAEAYARVIRNLRSDVKALAEEIARLQKVKARTLALAEHLQRTLLDAMTAMQIKSIHTSIGKWTVQRNPPGCDVLNADLVPAEYHIPQPDEIDKRAILAAFKATGEIPSGVAITQGTGLRFR